MHVYVANMGDAVGGILTREGHYRKVAGSTHGNQTYVVHAFQSSRISQLFAI